MNREVHWKLICQNLYTKCLKNDSVVYLGEHGQWRLHRNCIALGTKEIKELREKALSSLFLLKYQHKVA